MKSPLVKAYFCINIATIFDIISNYFISEIF